MMKQHGWQRRIGLARVSVVLCLCGAGFMGCDSEAAERVVAKEAEAPVARMVETVFTDHGVERIDEYYWLRERENPEVISYLEAENAYTEAQMAATVDLQDELFEEIKGRIKQDDSSVPYKDGAYWYYTRYEEGRQYPIHARTAVDPFAKGSLPEGPLEGEEVLLDTNRLLTGVEGEFLSARRLGVSPDETVLPYAEDHIGRRFYTIRFKNLKTGELLADTIEDVTGSLVWANDNQTVFYGKTTSRDPALISGVAPCARHAGQGRRFGLRRPR